YGIFMDDNNDRPTDSPGWPTGSSIKIMWDKQPGLTFCGAYVILMVDLSNYRTMSFWIKGQKGGEAFEIGLNDNISNKREDAVKLGSITRYLPEGVTAEWQEVKIPISDLFGLDVKRVYSMTFMFEDTSAGAFWVDDLRFHESLLVDRETEINEQGYLALDDFNYSYQNLLGRKANIYKKLPSVITMERVDAPRVGDWGKSLKLSYNKESLGWCGYYTLLNQIDGEFYDLSMYKSATFMIKGEEGGEMFELGMADRNWVNIGDSIKGGPIDKFLPGGITTEWQEVEVPLEAFKGIDFSQMGSFVLNFHKKSIGTVYIDNLRFHIKSEEELLDEW
ncbi:MAG: hypothetical protein JW937_09110, partial [Candidatus Omnitrophica bacterium]|nr:hypothetical protein [Candidatus Omnitrophota bacterium]